MVSSDDNDRSGHDESNDGEYVQQCMMLIKTSMMMSIMEMIILTVYLRKQILFIRSIMIIVMITEVILTAVIKLYT